MSKKIPPSHNLNYVHGYVTSPAAQRIAIRWARRRCNMRILFKIQITFSKSRYLELLMNARGIVVCENCDIKLLYKIKDNTVREINMITLFNHMKNRHAVRLIQGRCDVFFDRRIDTGGENIRITRAIWEHESKRSKKEKERKNDARRDHVRGDRPVCRSVGSRARGKEQRKGAVRCAR